jgi:hypothetical protein
VGIREKESSRQSISPIHPTQGFLTPHLPDHVVSCGPCSLGPQKEGGRLCSGFRQNVTAIIELTRPDSGKIARTFGSWVGRAHDYLTSGVGDLFAALKGRGLLFVAFKDTFAEMSTTAAEVSIWKRQQMRKCANAPRPAALAQPRGSWQDTEYLSAGGNAEMSDILYHKGLKLSLRQF